MTSVAAESRLRFSRLFSDFPEAWPVNKQATGEQISPATLSKVPSRLKFNPENVRNGLAKLVLTLVKLLQELMERQALRRIDGGSLTQEEIERLGETFVRLDEEIEKLAEYFGFTDDDLNLDLGPLGKVR